MSGKAASSELSKTIHTAWEKFLAGELDRALSLLHSITGIAENYATYHLVLASTLLAMKEDAPALLAAERTLELDPDSAHAKLVATLASERLEVLRAQRLQENSPREGTLAAMLDPEDQIPAPHFDLDRTADELARERPLVKPAPEPEHIKPTPLAISDDGPALVSETLAEIMIRQGKLTDAKKVYIQLSRMQPDRYGYFSAKIEAIDKLLLGTSIAPGNTGNDPVT